MTYRRFKIGMFLCAAAVFLLFLPKVSFADEWNYGISETDTNEKIDIENTDAAIDYEKKQIRLPLVQSPNAAAFSPDGSYSYAVLTEDGIKYFMFDGNQMIENTALSIDTTNPVGFAFAEDFPDTAVISKDAITAFRFTGSGMSTAAPLSVQGLSNATSITVLNNDIYSVLDGEEVKSFGFDGTSMIRIEDLAIQNLSSPVAVSGTKNYGLAVAEKDKVKYFGFTGSDMAQIPAMSILSGFTDLKSVAVDDGRITVVDSKQVKTFLFDGEKMSSVQALSVTDGLTAPSTIALRPQSYDMLIVDGKNVNYYSFNGNSMVKNDNLSTVVENIVSGTGYKDKATIQSKPISCQTNMVRVTANLAAPPGTTITWSVTADGISWVKKWRARGEEGEAVIEANNGSGWTKIGGVSVASTLSNTKELWAQVPQGNAVMWKAELETADHKITPVIMDIAGIAVKWETNSKPQPPSVIAPENGWYYTTTPTFYWHFTDLDEGDRQTAFQVEVRRKSDGAVVYDSGKVLSPAESFTLPTSSTPDTPGPLWSSGTYSFYVKVRTWDRTDTESEWSVPSYFKVLAFERPRISSIVSSPDSKTVPVPTDPLSHTIILQGQKEQSLPKVRAGTMVTVLLDSVGPIKDEAEKVAVFPCLNTSATVAKAIRAYESGHPVNRWTISFYTDASLEKVPPNTVVKMQAKGTGTEGGTTVFNLPPYADGIVKIGGTVYEDWFVMLQGSDKE